MSKKWLDEAVLREEEIKSNLAGLVAIESVLDEEHKSDNAPFGPNVRKALDYMLALGKKDGFNVKDVDGYAGVIEFGEGEEAMGLLGHLDIVPVGDGWSKDPLVMSEDQGYLFGRGTMDDKGPTIAAYTAMKMLKDSGFKPSKRIQLIMGCEEETNQRCMAYYLEHEQAPDFGIVPDATFPVVYGEKGIARFDISGQHETIIESFNGGTAANVVIGKAQATVKESTVKEAEYNIYLDATGLSGHVEGDTYFIDGVPAHASTPEEGKNGAAYLLDFISEAHNDELATFLRDKFMPYDGSGFNCKFEGKHMGDLTTNMGVITIKDAQTDIILDMRYPNDADFAEIEKNLVATMDSFGFKVEVRENKEPLFLDPESDMIQTLYKTYQEYTGDMDTPLMTMGGGTYARSFNNFVAFGMDFPKEKKPSIVGDVHQADEAVAVEALTTATAIYADVIEKLGK